MGLIQLFLSVVNIIVSLITLLNPKVVIFSWNCFLGKIKSSQTLYGKGGYIFVGEFVDNILLTSLIEFKYLSNSRVSSLSEHPDFTTLKLKYIGRLLSITIELTNPKLLELQLLIQVSIVNYNIVIAITTRKFHTELFGKVDKGELIGRCSIQTICFSIDIHSVIQS